MTTSDGMFGQTLATWLHEEAEHRVPDHLGEVLVESAATRQRPWWSSPERWLPLDTTSNLGSRLSVPRAGLVLALIGLLLLALVGTALITGAFRPSAPITGLATNGRILVLDGNQLKSYGADGTDPKVALSLPNGATDLAMSPDGTRVAMAVHAGPPRIDIMRVDGSGVVPVPTLPGTVEIGSAASWSPDGTQVVYLPYDGTRERLAVASSDGSTVKELDVDSIGSGFGLWSPVWSPDGRWIAFIAGPRDTDDGAIYLIRPDGTDLHAIKAASMAAGGGISWSPDPGVQRLLFTRLLGSYLASFVFDLTTGTETNVRSTFWPTWSPDGNRISFWGTEVMTTADALAGADKTVVAIRAWTDGKSCQEHPELKDQNFCGPASWSPDGTRLLAPDITGTSILSVMADGSGKPILIPLDTTFPMDSGGPVAWQPIR